MDMSIRFSEFGRKLSNDAARRNQQIIEDQFKPSVEREAFFNGGFKVGDIVESENKIQEVIDVRSNYVVLIDESGQTKKKFARDVRITEGSIDYPKGTFKGIAIGSDIVFDVVNEYFTGNIKDTYAVVKCARLFNEDRFDEFVSSVKNLGIDSIAESSEQLATLKIIGNVMGINGINDKKILVDEISSKFKKLKMTPEQKRILLDMINLAKKQGIKIDLTESDDPNTLDNEEEMIGKDNIEKHKKRHSTLKPDSSDKSNLSHTKPGSTLSDNDMIRRMKVRHLKGLD